ncbi:uncharacterized protein MJAP1_001805 [Malassezia japonica]|uniref:Nascent polypeptide-associated complex subunit alpha-like UBA domain-containing protein n=1 Tax=Malassezia japonica TaxID=223818 RepID=A0AAF0EXG0_9BASI|nr:uncharacterized protein MJAP1_001805 [Malassezia japonica]WFD38841.1 hypothetical protein MJAP1_001805 [Malassezia japonica]
MDSEGATFERGRMEANVQAICIQDPAGVPDSLKEAAKGVKVKPSDVSYLTQEFLLPTHAAEAALVASGGDVQAAVSRLLRSASA